ncbi:MAG TPA: transposase [Pararobbsia sp.]|nr:transposase [Pararobbsia sp.]
MTNLTDSEWKRVEHLFDETRQRKGAGRPAANPRAILDAIRWIQQTGERWLYLPATFPPQQTCYMKFLQWRKDGRIQEAERLLGSLVDQAVQPAHRTHAA